MHLQVTSPLVAMTLPVRVRSISMTAIENGGDNKNNLSKKRGGSSVGEIFVRALFCLNGLFRSRSWSSCCLFFR
jgi:hypothetical protein